MPSRLLVSCPDRPGIVAAVSGFLAENGANIVHADQHTTHADRRFFLRVEFDPGPLLSLWREGSAEGGDAKKHEEPGGVASQVEGVGGGESDLNARRSTLHPLFVPVARAFEMEARFIDPARRKRMAVFVSKEDHCLLELLLHQRAGDLEAEIAMVVSNHPDLAPLVATYGVPFHHVPMADKAQGEAAQMRLVAGLDLIVLAKYMQIVSPVLLREWAGRVVNIHHSFLPAFVGARPYHQAHRRGVKLIGATAHYVTEELDAGADHRAGRPPRRSPRRSAGAPPPRAASRARRPRSGRGVALRGPGDDPRRTHRRLRVVSLVASGADSRTPQSWRPQRATGIRGWARTRAKRAKVEKYLSTPEGSKTREGAHIRPDPGGVAPLGGGSGLATETKHNRKGRPAPALG